jgi:protein-S-isoprenylcysteine O-methyltransferase Ste14/NAD-dependent dihydropyrimidine dehydrogenase PreA subunit
LPIDPNFPKNHKKVGKDKGITIWGQVDPPKRLGIRGSNVAVDWDICTGCGICINVCPEHIYDWRETIGHPISEKKAFPIGESDCIQCFQCENKCPVKAVRVTYGGTVWENAIMFLMFTQIIVGISYGTIFGSYLGLELLLYIGWILTLVSLPFFFSTLIYFPKKGKAKEGKRFVDTTVVVNSGIYSLVRHPQILGCLMLMFVSILVSQHWLSLIIAIPISIWICLEIPKEEKGLQIRLGEDYKYYMQKVPKINLIVGIIRFFKHRKK